LGRVADISCGDAWRVYEEEDKDPGQSVVLVRTERGRKILHGAMETGYVTLTPAAKKDVLDSQGLVRRRWVVLFGRLLAMKLLLRPTPEYRNFSLYQAWKGLPLKERVKSVLGTLRRLVQRGMWRKRPIDWDKVVAVENTPSPAKSKSIEKEAV
jgi:coenzyme F420 hydrogenase subunit beta